MLVANENIARSAQCLIRIDGKISWVGCVRLTKEDSHFPSAMRPVQCLLCAEHNAASQPCKQRDRKALIWIEQYS